jgi:hypothetical protein
VVEEGLEGGRRGCGAHGAVVCGGEEFSSLCAGGCVRLGPRSEGPRGGYWQGFASFRVLCALALVATLSAAHAPGVGIGARTPRLHPAEEVPGASPCPAAPAAADGGLCGGRCWGRPLAGPERERDARPGKDRTAAYG